MNSMKRSIWSQLRIINAMLLHQQPGADTMFNTSICCLRLLPKALLQFNSSYSFIFSFFTFFFNGRVRVNLRALPLFHQLMSITWFGHHNFFPPILGFLEPPFCLKEGVKNAPYFFFSRTNHIPFKKISWVESDFDCTPFRQDNCMVRVLTSMHKLTFVNLMDSIFL